MKRLAGSGPNPSGFCMCGCGKVAPLAKQTRPSKGLVKGQPCRFLSGHYMRSTDYSLNIYVSIYDPTRKLGYVYEHALKAERALGRALPKGAEVHHVDGNRRNNANRNLVICQDVKYHRLLHARARVVRAGGNPNTEKFCGDCRTLKPMDEFCVNVATPTGRHTICRACSAVRSREYRRAKEAAERKGRAA